METTLRFGKERWDVRAMRWPIYGVFCRWRVRRRWIGRQITVNGRKGTIRKAYHAVRHSVFTGLIMNGLERSKAENFMRWRMGGTSGHYFSPQMFEIDLEAYPKHPHLKYWE